MQKEIKIILSLAILLSINLSAFDIKKKSGDVDTKLKIYGFSQLEARAGNGVIKDDQDADVLFSAQRVRLGVNYQADKVFGKLFLDFNKPHEDNGGIGLPDMIKDAFVGYMYNNTLYAKIGVMKMPHGMSFTMPGWNLDVVERGFDKKLAMERGTGIMVSGRGIGGNGNKVNGYEMGHERPWHGFGYDIMVANQAGRSGAVINAKKGDDNAYAIRAMYDNGEILHTELSYALSAHAGGLKEKSLAYKSINFGVDSHFGKGNGKFEYFDSQNIKGVDGWDESSYAITGTYYVTNTLELALKHIQGSAEKSNHKTDLGNTYIGFNFYLAPFNNKMSRSEKRKRNAQRIQLNYVVASGDKKEWNGLGGYKDNAILAQYQYKF
ncbi:hypothetical protein MNB_SV-13-1338 [hydrothermal vent metagenome]|uniref:Porin domain-containing protein n=1 Tax=hydrothermal vent metagenome TaxID=652676 RepID=A0A1W1BUR1_9ZZZZ